MSEYYAGEIMMWPGTFVPAGWLACDGSQVSISDYEVLFTLLGTTYGGDGNSTFALPDLRGRVPVHQGTLSGGSSYPLGQAGGATDVTVSTNQLPVHKHVMSASGNQGDTHVPANGVALASTGPAGTLPITTYAAAGQQPQVTLNNSSVTSSGSSQPHANMQPSLVIRYIISCYGLFPPQNN